MKNIYTKQLLKELSVLFKLENKKRLHDTLATPIGKDSKAPKGDNDAQLFLTGSTSTTANTFTNTTCNDANLKFASFSFLLNAIHFKNSFMKQVLHYLQTIVNFFTGASKAFFEGIFTGAIHRKNYKLWESQLIPAKIPTTTSPVNKNAMRNFTSTISPVTNGSNKKFSVRTFLPRKGIFAVVLLMVNLFLLNNAFGQILQRGSSTTSTSTNNITINKPTGVVAGDVLIVNIVQEDANDHNLSNVTVPSGWALIDGRTIYDAGNNVRQWWGTIMYRVADGSEGTTFTFNGNAAAEMTIGSMVAFSGVDVTGGFQANGAAGGPFDVAPGTINVSNSNVITATGITTNTNHAAIIMFGQVINNYTYQSNGLTGSWRTTSPGFLSTELYDNSTTNFDNASVGAAFAVQTTAGPTGNGTVTISNSTRNGGILIALRMKCPTINTTAGSNSPICGGPTLTLTATGASGGTPPYSYSWSGPGGYTSTSQNPSRSNPTSAMSGTYTVTATDNLGCTGSSNVAVVVNTPPTATGVTICSVGSGLLTSSFICPDESTASTAATFPGTATTGGAELTWSPSSGMLINTINADGGTTAISSYSGTGNASSLNRLTTNYSFSIPSGAIIKGISVNINRYRDGTPVVLDFLGLTGYRWRYTG